MRLICIWRTSVAVRERKLVPFIQDCPITKFCGNPTCRRELRPREPAKLHQEADMPFLFWLPIIVLSGMLSVAHAEVRRVRR